MKRIGLISATLLLAACAAKPPAPLPVSDESRALLASALARADKLPASTAGADAKATGPKMGGGNISINYAGEARVVLKQIAAARGLEFHVRGPQPYLPLFVIVDVKDVSLEGLLSDVGSQFGQRADVALTPKAIEVRYRDN